MRNSWLRRWFRRWLFRRMFPLYVLPIKSNPIDGQLVVVLDDDNDPPVWITRYSWDNDSFQTGGGWFERGEITYWAPVVQLDNPTLQPQGDS